MPDDAPERDVIERANAAYWESHEVISNGERMKAAIRVVLEGLHAHILMKEFGFEASEHPDIETDAKAYAYSIGIDLEEARE